MFSKRLCFLPISAVIILQWLGSNSAATDDARLKVYGEHLSRECTTCHRLDGIDNGIPSIIGWDDDQFVATLRFYQEGLRDNAAMVSVAKSLDDEQLRALATYFASIKSPLKKMLPHSTERR